MIIPARWYVGGRGLDSFRNEMLNDNRVRTLHDYPNASDCFPGVEIKGGVCFFLWERDNRGSCEVHSHSSEDVAVDKRNLLEDGMETFIRNSVAISILEKIRRKEEASFSEILNAGRYFGFHTKVNWLEDDTGTLQTANGQSSYPISSDQSDEDNIKVYIAHGTCWIAEKNVTRNDQDIDKYKVIIPRSGNPGSTIIGKPKISEPGSCSSNTYIVAIPKDPSLESVTNIISYLKTRFVRCLVAVRSVTQDIPPKAYGFVPMQDFSESWTDEKLYKKYGISEEEISYIESMVKPMELDI
jgi:site-specific DNA-methyltransferase (adenine-specific)